MIDIAIVNATQLLKDTQVSAIIPAIQSFDTEILAPAWQLPPATYHFVPYSQRLKVPTDGSVWPVFLRKWSDLPDALGYHEDQAGYIYGRCFVGDCLKYGIDWHTDLTHEVWEMRGDPTTEREVTLPDGRIGIVELCDPVEDDLYAIPWRGIKVSNFVLPHYFGIGGSWAGPWDYGTQSGLVHVPLQGPCPDLTSGGYQSLLVNGQWTQVTQMRKDGAMHPRAYRRGRSYRHRMKQLAQAA